MRSHPGSGWFVALVVSTLLGVGWPSVDERASRRRPPLAWRPNAAGLYLSAPAGWFEARPGGAHCLMRDPAQPQRGTCTLTVAPDLGDELQDQLLAALPGRRVEALQRRQLDGGTVLRVDWHAIDRRDQRPVRGVRVVCDRGAVRVQLDFSAEDACWTEVEHDVESMLASLAFEPL